VKTMSHGTVYGYRHGCRCDECREAKNASMRDYYGRNRKARGSGLGEPLLARTCGHCGAQMNRAPNGRPGECADCKWKRGSKLRVSQAERLSIYERDGWTCGICTEPVDATVPSNDRWGATLDHIVPRKYGGGDDAANLRLAHRTCNSSRGDASRNPHAELRTA